MPKDQLGRSAARCWAFGLTILLQALPNSRAQAQMSASSNALSLRTFFDSIRTGHPALLAANSRARAADASRVSARAFGNPVLSYQVDQTPFPGGQPLVGMEREAMTTATLPLEFLYQRGSKIARANAEARAAEADAFATRQRIALDAAGAFYRSGLAGIQSAVTHDLLSWLDTLVSYNRARTEEGVTAEADLIRSELERDRVAAEAAMQDAELAQARAAVGAFLGSKQSDPAPVVTLDDRPFAVPAANGSAGASAESRVGAPTTRVVAARPEVRAARERAAASASAVASERSMIPRQLAATIGTMQTGHTTSMIAGVSLPVPLFDQNRGEIKRASAERDAAVFDLAAQERMAVADLRGAEDAARILSESASRLAGRDSSGFLAHADESRRIALGAYREGAVPLFQVIDAARSWSEARMTYYRAIVAQQQSVLSLLVAQGRDILVEIPSPTSNGGSTR